MVDFKKDAWLYALLAAILAIIAIFTPWSSFEYMGITGQLWLGGEVIYITPVNGWSGSGLSLWTLGLTVFSIALLLFYGVNTWRGKEFKWDWLMYLLAGLTMLTCTILKSVLEIGSGAVIGFAPIGLIIASIIAIGAFTVDKILGRE